MKDKEYGDGVYALSLRPRSANDWKVVGYVRVKNLDQAGAPDCDVAEWALSIKAMEELDLPAELPLPEGASVQLDFHRQLTDGLSFADLVSELHRTESNQPLAAEDFNMFRVVSFRTRL